MSSVFISSTSLDLKEYREAVIDVCNSLQMTPVAMEFFEAMGVGATEGSKRKLDEADVYVGIFAHRYGYIEDGYEYSVTEEEFNYAGERGLERLCFVIDRNYPWEVAKIDFTNRDRLEAFKERVDKLIRKEFTDVNDLKAKVQHSLVAWRESNAPRPAALQALLIKTVQDVPNYKEGNFIGRGALLKRIHTGLSRGNRMLLQGSPGTGKTALAAAMMARYVKSGNTETLWLRAGDATADSLFEALAVPFKNGKTVRQAQGEARVAALKKLLRRVALVVLDDVWNGSALYQIVNAIPDKTALLVTSRRRFAGFKVAPVEQLSRADALKLLSNYAGASLKTDADADRLCERLGDLPFALRIAGLTMSKDSGNFTAGELLERINDAPQDLKLPFEDEKASVSALLHTSLHHRSLDPKARETFFAVGALFARTATPALLSLYLGHPKTITTEKYLDMLQANGLADRIKPKGDRLPYYRLHDLSYAYARARTSEQDCLKALTVCQQYVEKYAQNPRALEAAIENVLAAAAAAAAPIENGGLNRPDILIDLIYRLAVSDDSPYFEARGYTAQMFSLMQAAVEAAEQKADLKTVYNLVEKLGYAYLGVRDKTAAFQKHEQALAFAEQLGDETYQAIIRARLGSIWFDSSRQDVSRYPAVEAYYAGAEQMAKTNNDEYALAHVLQNQGYYYLNKVEGDLQHAWDLSEQAAVLAIRPDLDIKRIYFTAMLNRGGCEFEMERLDDALTTHEIVYQFAKAQGNPLWMAHARWSIGEDYTVKALQSSTYREHAQKAFDEAFALFCEWNAGKWASALASFVADKGYKVQSKYKLCLQ